MLQEILESVILLFVEQEHLINIQTEEVIDEFKTMNKNKIIIVKMYLIACFSVNTCF